MFNDICYDMTQIIILHLSRVLSCLEISICMGIPTMTSRLLLLMSQLMPFLRLVISWYYIILGRGLIHGITTAVPII